MNKRLICRVTAMIMCVCFVFNVAPVSAVYAEEAVAVSLDEQRDTLAKNLENVEKKLKKLGKQSKDTKEYLDVLDEKISILNERYAIAKAEVKGIEKKVAELEGDLEQNEKDIVQYEEEIAILQQDYNALNSDFESTYNAYCNRMRAIYVSGDQSNMLSFILQSDSIASMLTRYQMVAAISRQDGILLQTVKDKVDSILQTKSSLDEKNKELTEATRRITTNKASLESKKIDLLEKQELMESQQADIEEKQGEANKLLKTLNDKTKEYGEYRDITQEELDAIDAAIAEADRKYRESTTTTTTTKKTTTTTTTTTTTKPSGTNDESSTTTTTTTTTTEQAESPYIKLVYPCPAFTKITCGFGDYKGHTGCDFSTNKKENQVIVAAEDGIVILVKLLETSYGHYVVIRHDKTTSSGKTVYTLYAHNNDIVVSEGQHVSRGQQIAYSGTTGNSTGPHLHFEVRVGGSSQTYAVNPAIYLP